MSIKDQLRAAILSGGAKAFCPRGDFVDFNSQTFVAPQNGYICLGVRSNAVNQWFSLGASVSQVLAIPNAGQNPEGYIPVRKGETARLAHSDGMPVNFMRFFPSVGGGKSPVAQLFWRVVPCLRTCLTRALTPIADRIRVSSQGAILQLTSRSRQGMRMLTQPLTFLRATACSLFSVSPLKATPTTTSRFDEISSTVGSLGATGRRGRFLRLLAERAKRFTGMCGSMELLRTSRRTSAFTHTSALNVCFGGASYE